MKVKTYALKTKNMTAWVPTDFMDAWKDALAVTGLTNAQGFMVATALFYERPELWTEDPDLGDSPTPDGSPNFHTRVPGILGTYVETIRETITDKRLAQNDTKKATLTDVIVRIMAWYIQTAQSGRLMSLGLG